MPTDKVSRFLGDASHRLRASSAMTGGAIALAVGAAAAVVLQMTSTPVGHARLIVIGVGLAGAAAGWLSTRRNSSSAAAAVEARSVECRNLLITVEELLHRPAASRSSAYVSALLLREADSLVDRLDLKTIVPLRGVAVALAAALLLAALATGTGAARIIEQHPVLSAGTMDAVIIGIDADILLPAYAGGKAATVHEPARMEVFAGSTIRIHVRARATSVAIETLTGVAQLQRNGGGGFTGEVVASADGFIALEPTDSAGHAGARRLIGLSVIPDLAPRVRVTAPGHDIKLADGHHTIDLAIESDDDIGLASLRLRYTRVAGSGERFTFTEGEVPLAISRVDRRTWKARAAWRLDSLKLGAGDMVVYRAVASDARPGAAPTESDSYIAEVLAPGGIAAAGFALDPEVERYALSEQMVILKTEKLLPRKEKMSADSFADAAAEIAAEQRRVRAEFVFMMGGEVGGADDPSGDLNEVAETEAGGDLAAGRMLSQGRIALMSAIRSMSRADKALTAPDLAAALTHEHAALTQLELTFSHNRIILRALAERERLDLTRRLGGALADAARDVRPIEQPIDDIHVTSLRQSLGEMAALASKLTSGKDVVTRVSTLAERVLRVDPSSHPLQQVAQGLTDAASAIGRGDPATAHDLLDRAATALSASIRNSQIRSPGDAPSLDASRVSGALSDALRHAKAP